MIVKGAARSGPKQLANYLMRVYTPLKGDKAELIELHAPTENLVETFRDWQVLAEGTRQGRDGLYHAQINPAAEYARTMTPEQWKRAADLLGEELGLKDQPRALVIHEGNGRPHLHVVWQRTDIDTMKLVSDSNNYLAHERASQRMELEFGHEFVPGKHAKRDRKQQPEFPKAEISHAEWQQAERTGLDPKARKAQITALHRAADSGPAFKAALEDAGYILAKGDRRDFVIVDDAGESHSLSRQIKGVKAKDLRDFMAGVDPARLPTAAEAEARQADMRRQKEAALVDARSAPQPEPAPPAPAQPRSKFFPELAAVPPAQAAGPAAPESGAPARTRPAALDPVVEHALKERQAKEAAKLIDWQAGELKQLRHVLDLSIKEKLAHLNALQKAERDRFEREQQAKRGFIDALKRRFSPKQAAKQAEAQARALDAIKARQEQARKAQIERLTLDKAGEIDALKEKQAQQVREQKARFAQERERYLNEQEATEQLRQRIEAERRERERGPEPPKRGK